MLKPKSQTLSNVPTVINEPLPTAVRAGAVGGMETICFDSEVFMRAIKGRWASNYADQGKAPQLSDEKSLTKPFKEPFKSNQIKSNLMQVFCGGWGLGAGGGRLSLFICNKLLKCRE